ncbi:MAG: rRNA maturation RNase YbeY [Lachnospiraceae bacterium]|nr:rRNA maturation RNase YbeY [Lachnospiraceae bacterium]
MRISIENEYSGGDFARILPFDYQKTAEDVAAAALRLENCPFEAAADILLTGDEEMRAINLETRKIDRTTDVLSFPANEFEQPGDFSCIEEGSPDSFDPDSGEFLLGDIVLSLPRIREQAASFGHSTRREYAFLIAHSIFHLLGYDHMSPEEEAVMMKKQETVLEMLGIRREEKW